MYDYSKLGGKITEVFKTRTNFGKALGISKGAISKKLNNHTDFSQKEIVKAIELLDIKEEEVGTYFFKLKV